MQAEKQQSRTQQKEDFWLMPSRHAASGIFHYAYYRIDRQEEITTPASHQADLIFVVNGGCLYEGFEVKKGDVFVHGMNKSPVTSFSTDIELFVIGTRYEVLYRRLGIMPSHYQAQALKFTPEHRLSRFGQILAQLPSENWVEMAEDFVGEMLSEQAIGRHCLSFECALQAARNMEERGSFDEEACCREFGISKRHLQRQFVRFFGFTMRDYDRMLRFSQAFCELGDHPLAETALLAGYYDQAHMNREFRQMAGLSPQWAARHMIYAPLKETIKRRTEYKKSED